MLFKTPYHPFRPIILLSVTWVPYPKSGNLPHWHERGQPEPLLWLQMEPRASIFSLKDCHLPHWWPRSAIDLTHQQTHHQYPSSWTAHMQGSCCSVMSWEVPEVAICTFRSPLSLKPSSDCCSIIKTHNLTLRSSSRDCISRSSRYSTLSILSPPTPALKLDGSLAV